MKVIFTTNIDHYKTNCFPENITIPPRIGEKVVVTPSFGKYFFDKNLPTRLEVVDVSWTEKAVVCELWYNAQDKKMAEANGAKTL